MQPSHRSGGIDSNRIDTSKQRRVVSSWDCMATCHLPLGIRHGHCSQMTGIKGRDQQLCEYGSRLQITLISVDATGGYVSKRNL